MIRKKAGGWLPSGHDVGLDVISSGNLSMNTKFTVISAIISSSVQNDTA